MAKYGSNREKNSVALHVSGTIEHPCGSTKSLFIEITLWHGCSPVNSLHIFRTPFLRTLVEGWFEICLSVTTIPIKL